MKIGFDAKWFFDGPISGKVVLQNTLPNLFELYPEHDWFLFFDKKDELALLPFYGPNIHVHYVWAGFNMLSNLFVLPFYIKKLKLDVMVFQNFSIRRKNCKSIVFIHDILFEYLPEYFTWKERLYFKPMKWSSLHADRIITTTEFVKKDLQKYNYATNLAAIDIVPLGVSNRFKPLVMHDNISIEKVKEKYNLPEQYLLFVGRLNIRKNIQGLLNALPLLGNNDIPLIIVGKTDWKVPQLDNLLSEESIKKRVLFTGAVKDDELAIIYALAKVFCFPSFAEGFGLPPIEAMASGIPVVVSGRTALPEVCGAAGNFIDPDDPSGIADMINKLLEDQQLYETKVQQGLFWASQFSWQRTAKRLMESIQLSYGTNHLNK